MTGSSIFGRDGRWLLCATATGDLAGALWLQQHFESLLFWDTLRMSRVKLSRQRVSKFMRLIVDRFHQGEPYF